MLYFISCCSQLQCMQYIVHSLIATFSSFENFKNLHAMDILYINILHCFLLDRQYTNNVVHFMKHAYIDPRANSVFHWWCANFRMMYHCIQLLWWISRRNCGIRNRHFRCLWTSSISWSQQILHRLLSASLPLIGFSILHTTKDCTIFFTKLGLLKTCKSFYDSFNYNFSTTYYDF